MAKLEYTWQDNAATQDDDNDYYPKVVNLQYKTEEDLIKDIAVPGSILKETELRAVKRRVFQQIAKYIELGSGYKDNEITVKPGLRGNAYNPDEPWNDERHVKYASALLGKIFQEAAAGMELQFVPKVKEAAVIETIYDRKSNTTNDRLTPGHSVKITGYQLKIHDSSQGGEGLFFVNRADGKEYPAELEDNFPSQLRADVPDDLPAGEYYLKIVNTKRDNSTTLRTALSGIVLTVES